MFVTVKLCKFLYINYLWCQVSRVQHNEILHVGDIARITEKEVRQLSLHVAIVTKVYTIL